MAIDRFTVPGTNGKVKIFAEAANINYFLNTGLQADVVGGITDKLVNVKGSTRRQYPGDISTVSVNASSRIFMKDPSKRSGNALPGKNFRLRAVDEDGNQLQNRTFTFQGPLTGLHAFLANNMVNKTYFYGPNGGKPYVFPPVTP